MATPRTTLLGPWWWLTMPPSDHREKIRGTSSVLCISLLYLNACHLYVKSSRFKFILFINYLVYVSIIIYKFKFANSVFKRILEFSNKNLLLNVFLINNYTWFKTYFTLKHNFKILLSSEIQTLPYIIH